MFDWFQAIGLLSHCKYPRWGDQTRHPLTNTDKKSDFSSLSLYWNPPNKLSYHSPPKSTTDMDIMKMLLPCCLGASHEELIDEPSDAAVTEKFGAYTDVPSNTELQAAANETSDKLLHLITTVDVLNTLTSNMQMQDIIASNKPITVQSSRWTKLVLDKLYKAMLELVTKIVEMREKLSPMMRKVVKEAEHFAHELEEFQEEHSILTAFIVLIAVLAPIQLEALGFGVEGVVEGECSILMLMAMLLTDDKQAVSPRDSSLCTLTCLMARCSQSCRASPLDTERVLCKQQDRRTTPGTREFLYRSDFRG